MVQLQPNDSKVTGTIEAKLGQGYLHMNSVRILIEQSENLQGKPNHTTHLVGRIETVYIAPICDPQYAAFSIGDKVQILVTERGGPNQTFYVGRNIKNISEEERKEQ